MSMMGLAAISTVLLLIAWLLWLKCGEAASVRQGILLATVTAAWFFRIVFAG